MQGALDRSECLLWSHTVDGLWSASVFTKKCTMHSATHGGLVPFASAEMLLRVRNMSSDGISMANISDHMGAIVIIRIVYAVSTIVAVC